MRVRAIHINLPIYFSADLHIPTIIKIVQDVRNSLFIKWKLRKFKKNICSETLVLLKNLSSILTI